MGDEYADVDEDGYRTKAFDPKYATETDPDDPTNPFHNAPAGNNYTEYLSDEQRASYELTFADGVAQQEGQDVDTYSSTGVDTLGFARQKVNPEFGDHSYGRQIFTMDDDGTIYSANPLEEVMDRKARFHHSSLAQGDEVAGAGEMQIRDGVVEVVSDQSGHYRPDMGMTGQVLDSLEDQGIGLEGVGVELSPKNLGDKRIKAGALEVQSYGDATEDELAGRTPEEVLRSRHAQRDGMLNELRQATAETRDDLDAEADARQRRINAILAGEQQAISPGVDSSALQGQAVESDYTIMTPAQDSPLRSQTIASDYTITTPAQDSPLRGQTVASDYTIMTAAEDSPLRGQTVESDYTIMTPAEDSPLRGQTVESDDTTMTPTPDAGTSDDEDDPAQAIELALAQITGPQMDDSNQRTLKNAGDRSSMSLRVRGQIVLVGDDYDGSWAQAMVNGGATTCQIRVERARIGAGRVVVTACPPASQGAVADAIGRISDKKIVFA